MTGFFVSAASVNVDSYFWVSLSRIQVSLWGEVVVESR